MKVKELKELLSKLNDEDEMVIMRRDESLYADFEIQEISDDYFLKDDKMIKEKCIVMW